MNNFIHNRLYDPNLMGLIKSYFNVRLHKYLFIARKLECHNPEKVAYSVSQHPCTDSVVDITHTFRVVLYGHTALYVPSHKLVELFSAVYDEFSVGDCSNEIFSSFDPGSSNSGCDV